MTFSRNDMAEEALLELSREQRRSGHKWMIAANDQWVQREMIRVRDGNGWIEFQVRGGNDGR